MLGGLIACGGGLALNGTSDQADAASASDSHDEARSGNSVDQENIFPTAAKTANGQGSAKGSTDASSVALVTPVQPGMTGDIGCGANPDTTRPCPYQILRSADSEWVKDFSDLEIERNASLLKEATPELSH